MYPRVCTVGIEMLNAAPQVDFRQTQRLHTVQKELECITCIGVVHHREYFPYLFNVHLLFSLAQFRHGNTGQTDSTGIYASVLCIPVGLIDAKDLIPAHSQIAVSPFLGNRYPR